MAALSFIRAKRKQMYIATAVMAAEASWWRIVRNASPLMSLLLVKYNDEVMEISMIRTVLREIW